MGFLIVPEPGQLGLQVRADKLCRFIGLDGERKE